MKNIFEFFFYGERPLNPWDGWEGYFGQGEWHKINSTNKLPIAFLDEYHEESPYFCMNARMMNMWFINKGNHEWKLLCISVHESWKEWKNILLCSWILKMNKEISVHLEYAISEKGDKCQKGEGRTLPKMAKTKNMGWMFFEGFPIDTLN